jgi:prevent-host-death family protein
MGTVGVKELKNRLTHYLRRAKDGEEVVVTERGRPIALIQSIRSAQPAQSLEAKLPRARIGGRPISETILDDRR